MLLCWPQHTPPQVAFLSLHYSVSNTPVTYLVILHSLIMIAMLKFFIQIILSEQNTDQFLRLEIGDASLFNILYIHTDKSFSTTRKNPATDRS
jgi:hypothetical protein